jgi:hypothetical protein
MKFNIYAVLFLRRRYLWRDLKVSVTRRTAALEQHSKSYVNRRDRS